MVVGLGGGEDVVGLEGVEVGGSGEVSSEASDGVFDAAFLPGAVRVAEEGLEADLVVLGELGSVVEGEGAPEGLGQGRYLESARPS